MKNLLLGSFMVFLLGCAGNTSSPDVNALVATGMLKTRDYIITLYTSGTDQLYTVRALDGTALEENLTIESMIALFPDLAHLKDSDNLSWAGLDNNVESLGINPGTLDNR